MRGVRGVRGAERIERRLRVGVEAGERPRRIMEIKERGRRGREAEVQNEIQEAMRTNVNRALLAHDLGTTTTKTLAPIGQERIAIANMIEKAAVIATRKTIIDTALTNLIETTTTTRDLNQIDTRTQTTANTALDITKTIKTGRKRGTRGEIGREKVTMIVSILTAAVENMVKKNRTGKGLD